MTRVKADSFIKNFLLLLILILAKDSLAFTPQEQALLQQLSPTQRENALKMLKKQGGGLNSQSQKALDSPELVIPTGVESTETPRAEQGPLQVSGGDTLILTFASKFVADDIDLTKKDDKELPEKIVGPVAKLLGTNLYLVNRLGVLELPGVGRIPLAGLTEVQVAARLMAEPVLKLLDVTVTILPLERKGKEALKPFGYDLFDGAPTTFAPATDIPVPSEYIIGPGDTINIQLFGKENAEYQFVVTRDGTINIPELGPISVVGENFDSLKKRIDRFIGEKMIGVKANVTMGQLRSIRVYVLGDANRPGSYTVSSLSTMTNALFVSGGVKEIGSLRNIQLKRNGKLITKLDLYDLLLRGDTSGDKRLQPGDVIFIPPVGTTVGVAGEVRRPAIYELKGEKSVKQIIELAGGLLPTAHLEASQIERISPDGERALVDINKKRKKGEELALINGDVLRVFSVVDEMDDVVVLEGHVERPGGYQWRKGMRLTDLIPTFDDLQPGATLDYAVIRREVQPSRRITVLSVELGKALTDPQSPHNILLQPRDKMYVFSRIENPAETMTPLIEELRNQSSYIEPERVVHVSGLVKYPGDYPLEKAMRVSDLIRAAGSFMQNAYTLGAEITRFEVINGMKREQKRLDVDLSAVLKGDLQQDVVLKPFDVLLIRKLPSWDERMSVEIGGEVLFPGTYEIKPNETLLDVIKRAGGLTEYAYPQASVFMREHLRKKEQEQIDRLKEQLQSDMASIALESAQRQGADSSAANMLSMVDTLIKQLDTSKAAGRLVINLPAILEEKDDLIVKDGDRLFIPQKPQEVMIIGEVNYPSSHVYNPAYSRDDYIQRSGGLTYKADDDRIYIVRANGQIDAEKGSIWFAGDEQQIKPGDTIVVPLDATRLEPLTLWTSVTQIIYQLGVAAAAWNSIGVF